VTVFVDAEGEDAHDAHRVAELAVTAAVTAAGLTFTTNSGVVRAVEVVDVMTVNAALRSGALSLFPADPPRRTGHELWREIRDSASLSAGVVSTDELFGDQA
jgi:hypothetical protein